MANCGLLLNDGSSFVLLNDGTSAILLNDNTCAFEPGQGADQAPDILPSGSNYLAWWQGEWERIHRERVEKRKRKKISREKREVLEELDSVLSELHVRVAEQEAQEHQASLRRIEAFAEVAMDARITLAMVREQIRRTEEIMREMDDEEAIILALH